MSRAPIMQRHEVVAEAREHRRDEEEDHRHAVHREELVVGLGREQALARAAPAARACSGRLEPAEEEEDERGADVAHADPLVVDGREPARARPAGSAHERAQAVVRRRPSPQRPPGRRAGPAAPAPLRAVAASCCPASGAAGSRIQPARYPGVLGTTPAPIDRRDARWVRSGPIWPLAFVPSIVWQ